MCSQIINKKEASFFFKMNGTEAATMNGRQASNVLCSMYISFSLCRMVMHCHSMWQALCICITIIVCINASLAKCILTSGQVHRDPDVVLELCGLLVVAAAGDGEEVVPLDQGLGRPGVDNRVRLIVSVMETRYAQATRSALPSMYCGHELCPR